MRLFLSLVCLSASTACIPNPKGRDKVEASVNIDNQSDFEVNAYLRVSSSSAADDCDASTAAATVVAKAKEQASGGTSLRCAYKPNPNIKLDLFADDDAYKGNYVYAILKGLDDNPSKVTVEFADAPTREYEVSEEAFFGVGTEKLVVETWEEILDNPVRMASATVYIALNEGEEITKISVPTKNFLEEPEEASVDGKNYVFSPETDEFDGHFTLGGWRSQESMHWNVTCTNAGCDVK